MAIKMPGNQDQVGQLAPAAGSLVGGLFGPVGSAVGGLAGGQLAGSASQTPGNVEPPKSNMDVVQRRMDMQTAGPKLERGLEIAKQEAPELAPVIEQALAKSQAQQAEIQKRRQGGQ